ncbi:MAG: FHA domain-containing protein [Inquilinus sp.]|nr:FHA domain-containing protein [Inquilinus sp.]
MTDIGELESGWRLDGSDGAGRSIRLLIGETQLASIYLGVTVGRHPALCDLVIDDPSVSRRHLRIGRAAGGLFVEDVHALNDSYVEDRLLAPFEPESLEDGDTLTLGRVTLTLSRLGDEAPI